MEKKFLPIGTVVLLKGATKELMITSYLVVSKGHGVKDLKLVEPTNEMFDYGACTFPEGIINSDAVVVFNHDEIDKVVFMGCNNEKQQSFGKVLLDKENEIRSLHKSGKLFEDA